MKATIWSAMVPSHTPQHGTEKRTQNTNWKTVHMLDSTIWWKAENSHPLEKNIYTYCHLLILKSFHHTVSRIPIIFVCLSGSTLLWSSLPSTPSLHQNKSSSISIPLRAFIFFKGGWQEMHKIFFYLGKKMLKNLIIILHIDRYFRYIHIVYIYMKCIWLYVNKRKYACSSIASTSTSPSLWNAQV